MFREVGGRLVMLFGILAMTLSSGLLVLTDQE
jgi:hypothetical protein